MIPANGDASDPSIYQPFDVSSVTLDRSNNKELGFNVVGGKDSEHLPGIAYPFVASVRPHGEAFRRGIREGDRIITVNDVDVNNMNHNEVVDLLRSGETVHLTIEPNGEERIITETMSALQLTFGPNQNNNNNNESLHSERESLAAMADRDIVDISPDTPQSKKAKSKLEKEFEEKVPESVYKRNTQAVYFGIGLAVGALAILTYVHGRQFFTTFKGRIAAYFIKSAVMPEETIV